MENLHNNLASNLKINGDKCEENIDSEGEYFSDGAEDADDVAAQKSASKVDRDQQAIDESALLEKEKELSDSEKESRRSESLRLKELGNTEYKNCNYQGAVDFYTDAIQVCLLSLAEDRAILYSNRSAAYIQLSRQSSALEDSEKAVALNPSYVRARLRRAELYEKVDKLDEALEDYKKVLEQDPGQHSARAACMRLPDQIKVRNEKMKDEMIGKLKDLGNLVLRPFGLSTDNFKLQQDPNTGSYSVNFQQNLSRNA